MQEFIDILTENGQATNKIKERSQVHKDGDWHKVVQLFVINGSKILLQQRALTKKSEPGKWCASASGHISAGENSYETAVKEFNEELGLKIEKDKLQLIDSFKSPSVFINNGERIYNNHFVDLYISKQKINIDDVKIQTGEVCQVKFFEINDFEKMVKMRDQRLTDTPILFEHLLNALTKLNITME